MNRFVLNNKDKIETVNNMPEDNSESLKRLYERVDFLKTDRRSRNLFIYKINTKYESGANRYFV